ncbi:MAG: hypothetical protein PHN88_08875 [Ignavibacteria bacterium]|nr:hypothetical protein [Ignavibacteria bacterium]
MRPFSGRNRFFFVPMFLIAIAGFSAITMLLWNAIIPDIFHLPALSFWQTAGLLILSRLLFGFKIPKHSHHNRHVDLREKWEHMNEQERNEFRNQWKEHRSWWTKTKNDNVNQQNEENK